MLSYRELPHAPAAAELSLADLIAIADRLFAAEATWHKGNPLAQTVFTCLYLLEPHRYVIQLSVSARMHANLISYLVYIWKLLQASVQCGPASLQSMQVAS